MTRPDISAVGVPAINQIQSMIPGTSAKDTLQIPHEQHDQLQQRAEAELPVQVDTRARQKNPRAPTAIEQQYRRTFYGKTGPAVPGHT